MLEEHEGDCAERAWLLILSALPVLFQGDAATALPQFEEADRIARRCDDYEVQTFVRLSQGTALLMMNERQRGLALLDETMVAVTSGEISPILSGIAYCQVIAVCREIFDFRRAREWTAALTRWCDSNKDIVPYRGNCMVHRCEILQLQGAWQEAADAAAQACEYLMKPSPWDVIGYAYYLMGEMHRLRGELSKAEEAYRQASRSGHDPEPGMSLLRLAQGQTESAAASIRRVLGATEAPVFRAAILPAYVEIMAAAGDLAAARSGASELGDLAEVFDAPPLRAAFACATAVVLLAEGNVQPALDHLRAARSAWQEIEAPYEVARVRVKLASAYRLLGDEAGAEMELEGACWTFEQLGARIDLTEAKRAAAGAEAPPAGLTAREIEVLRLLVAGQSNREVSRALVISEHTVARHVQNIFAKLGVSSRAAAIAAAYRQKLV
jgi:ATP/maltotriose-dependent transcriptional regulator MalT